MGRIDRSMGGARKLSSSVCHEVETDEVRKGTFSDNYKTIFWLLNNIHNSFSPFILTKAKKANGNLRLHNNLEKNISIATNVNIKKKKKKTSKCQTSIQRNKFDK